MKRENKWIQKKPILVTGAAGFIGAALTIYLLKKGENIIGIDNINEYYDKNLKHSRLQEIELISKKYSGNWFFIENL